VGQSASYGDRSFGISPHYVARTSAYGADAFATGRLAARPPPARRMPRCALSAPSLRRLARLTHEPAFYRPARAATDSARIFRYRRAPHHRAVARLAVAAPCRCV